jgi:CHAD domain-containing protein
MSYLINATDPVDQQIPDVFAEQIQVICSCLKNYPDMDPEGLHSSRKCLKRLRALLRLIRKKKYKENRKGFNYRLRDIAASLSSYRDKEVLALLLGQVDPGLSDATDAREPIDPSLLEKTIQSLLELEQAFRTSRPPIETRKQLQKGASACMAIMVEAFRQYSITRSLVHLHEFRKRTKDHMYHLELLSEILPADEAYSGKIQEMEDLLGDARDCDLVLEHLEDGDVQPKASAEKIRVHFILEKDRILKQAMSVAEASLPGKPWP